MQVIECNYWIYEPIILVNAIIDSTLLCDLIAYLLTEYHFLNLYYSGNSFE